METHRLDEVVGWFIAVGIVAGMFLWMILRYIRKDAAPAKSETGRAPQRARVSSSVRSGAERVDAAEPDAKGARTTEAGYQQIQLPFLTRLRSKWFARWQPRDTFDFEWSIQYDLDSREFVFTFFVERAPARLDLSFLTIDPIHVDRLVYSQDDEVVYMDFGVESQRQGDTLRLRVTPARRVETAKVMLRLTHPLPDVGWHTDVKVAGNDADDLSFVLNAHRWADAGSFENAVEQLHFYEQYSTENASISYWLSDWYQQLGNIETAEQYALQAVLRGNPEVCAERYRNVQREREPRGIEDIRALQVDAQQWPLPGHHGILVLERRQQFVLALANCHLMRCHQTFEIRRAAAARMLSELSFPFSSFKELVLFTSLRIIHPDDSVEEVPLEHFTIGDHESKNTFITVEDEKAGHWILPDLATGDVIEWTYHLLCGDPPMNGSPHTFIHASQFDGYSPTFSSRTEFVAPEGHPLRFSVRNGNVEESRSVVDAQDITVFESKRLAPNRHTGFVFEHNYLNPVVVCATDGIGWQQVAHHLLKLNFGEIPTQDKLPAPLGPLVEGGSEQASTLEYAYYWIRDQLKYASVRSGAARIGHSDRARRIVEAGVGDCNDKSYLLSLVCQRLNVPYELVAVSTKYGILIEDAPANQFDHVFLRAKVDGRWIYLDAAAVSSTFGSPPSWCQGLRALALDDAGSIITIPVDPPESNALEISEVFDVCRDGRLHGRFRFRASGQSARLIDGRWKSLSLSLDDQQQAGQEALRQFLPSSIVLGYSRDSDTSVSSHFDVSGQHSRGPLVSLGTNRTVIGSFAWQIPFLPLSYWRTLQIERMFVVESPIKVQIDVRFEGDVYRLLDAASRIRTYDTPVCSVCEEVVEDGQMISVRRTIMFKKKFMHGDDVSLVAPGLEQIEEALQLVVSLDPAGI